LARPCEVRRAKWEQFHWEERLWKIPAENMKEDRWHVVHLADQTMELLMELKDLSGDCEQLFPGIDDRYNRDVLNDSKPISEATMLSAIRKMGYECDAHGFRGTASTFLHSLEDDDERQMWDSKWIEFALSHKDKDQVAMAYNAYRYQKPRARMLQFYADQVLASN
jgi:integrase